MPPRTKKDHQNNHQGSSRWNSFHFSGKLILCSVFIGLMLLLIGGIILAIGMDRADEPEQSGDLTDVQKKPPLVIVGPVVMGIGGVTTFVAIVMCLFETKVCRKKSADSNPLIVGNEEEDSATRSSDTMVKELETSPSSGRYNRKHRHGHSKKIINGGKVGGDSKTQKSPQVNISPASGPIGIHGASKSYLSSSDTFMTPPSTLTQGAMHMNARDADNQASTTFLRSFSNSGKSWNVSTDFQTPSTSFNDSLSFERSQEVKNIQEPTNKPPLQVEAVVEQHQFVTPQNSDAEQLAPLTERMEEMESSVETPAVSETKVASGIPEVSAVSDSTKTYSMALEEKEGQLNDQMQNISSTENNSALISQENNIQEPANKPLLQIETTLKKHEFVTPQNSVAEQLAPFTEGTEQETCSIQSPLVNKTNTPHAIQEMSAAHDSSKTYPIAQEDKEAQFTTDQKKSNFSEENNSVLISPINSSSSHDTSTVITQDLTTNQMTKSHEESLPLHETKHEKINDDFNNFKQSSNEECAIKTVSEDKNENIDKDQINGVNNTKTPEQIS